MYLNKSKSKKKPQTLRKAERLGVTADESEGERRDSSFGCVSDTSGGTVCRILQSSFLTHTHARWFRF